MASQQERQHLIDALITILQQLKADDGTVSLLAKAQARVAVEPFLGDVDPATLMSLEDAKAILPKDDEGLARLLYVWRMTIGEGEDSAIMLSEVIDLAHNRDNPELYEAIYAIEACLDEKTPTPDALKLGHWLRQFKDIKTTGGHVLHSRTRSGGRASLWWVEHADAEEDKFFN